MLGPVQFVVGPLGPAMGPICASRIRQETAPLVAAVPSSARQARVRVAGNAVRGADLDLDPVLVCGLSGPSVIN